MQPFNSANNVNLKSSIAALFAELKGCTILTLNGFIPEPVDMNELDKILKTLPKPIALHVPVPKPKKQ